MAERRQTQQETQRLAQVRRRLDRSGLKVAARGFAQRTPDDHGEDQSGNADEHQRAAPADRFAREAGNECADRGADRRLRGEYRERARAAVLRKQIRHHRHRRRTAARFTDRDAGARQRQRQKSGHRTLQQRHRAPERERHRDDAAARFSIGESRDRNLRQRVENAERGAGEQTELRIGQLQILADRYQQQVDDGAIDDVERAHAEQHRERVVRIAAAEFERARRARRPGRSRRARASLRIGSLNDPSSSVEPEHPTVTACLHAPYNRATSSTHGRS